MTDVTPAQIKGLFFHLVGKVGGVVPAGAYLGVSHQRVSILQSVNHPDMPSLMQVVTLERVVGQDIVTGALSRAATGKPDTGEVLDEVMDAHAALANLQESIRKGKPHREQRAALIRTEAEVDQVAAALDRNADQATTH